MIDLRLKDFDTVLKQLKEKKLSFEVNKTSYTKRIKIGKKLIMFSDNKMSMHELKLIQMIRTSAGLFEVPSLEQDSPAIDFYKFYDIHQDKLIHGVKIDLDEAYWQCAINMGLVTPEIQYYFENCKDKLGGKKGVKKARLRCLGALATKNVVSTYENGKMTLETLKINEANRELYLYICEQVSRVMSELAMSFIEYVVYYYWDCIFLNENVSVEEVKKKVKELGYNCKVEGKGKYEVVKGKHINYLYDSDKDIKYPINRNDIIN